MLHVIKKWKIKVSFAQTTELKIYISDDFYQNVLKKLSEIEFDFEPISIIIEESK